ARRKPPEETKVVAMVSAKARSNAMTETCAQVTGVPEAAQMKRLPFLREEARAERASAETAS
ncbi:MAG TPA: hypothetical protein VJK52_02660, partial [Candidatus Nanoarchaeia archaeon]|nr:hypothetical protein [Candidatus Nanoarchaeia archaeon]